MWSWINGQYVSADELRISPFDHGFLYGLGFFETFRTYGGHVFLLPEHLERLKRGLADYRIDWGMTMEEVQTIVSELTKRSEGRDGYFRLNVSAGIHDIGLAPDHYEKPTTILFRKELPATERGTEKTAIWLQTKRNLPESAVRHKSHHYANNVKARLELPSLAKQEGLFVTEDEYVAEGITSNVFWVKNNELFTPSLKTGILAGTTRAWVIKTSNKLGISVKEGLFRKEDVEQADEVFCTNAIQELIPIQSVETYTFSGNEGPVYQQLHQAYVEDIKELQKRGYE